MDSIKPTETIQFPDTFKFGVADSDLQVIGENETRAREGSELTMWSAFAEQGGIEKPDVGSDRYNRWQEDIEHMREMGVKHYRTSVSMARLLRQNGDVNPRAVEWYKTYFKHLRNAGVSIYLSLHHWELPQYLNAAGGWTNREVIVPGFMRHVEAVVEHLGEWVDEYLVLNEPWCSSILCYYLGDHAPGKQHKSDKKNLEAALWAAHHLLLVQGLAVRDIKRRAPGARVGTALNVQTAYAASPSPEDLLASRHGDGNFNTWFFDPLFTGRYPEYMVELYGEETLPPGYEDDMEAIKVGDELYALGINYYRGSTYRAASGELPFEDVVIEGGQTNHLGWPIYLPPHYSEGLYDVLQQVYYSYRTYGLKRMYLTENGTALDTSWDEQRIDYLRAHLHQVYKAILRGLPIEAYFAWTLMDNYEWAEGYSAKSSFGLIHVDRPSLKRSWKQSAYWYQDLMKTGVLS